MFLKTSGNGAPTNRWFQMINGTEKQTTYVFVVELKLAILKSLDSRFTLSNVKSNIALRLYSKFYSTPITKQKTT